MCWGSFSNYDISRIFYDSNTIRIEQLPITLATLSKLKLKSPFLVKNLKICIISC